MLLFEPGSPFQGTREAGKRLISFYGHAARGGIVLASSYLDRCQVESAIREWMRQTDAARENGLLRIFKANARRRRLQAAEDLLHWRNHLAMQRHSEANVRAAEQFAWKRCRSKPLQRLSSRVEHKELNDATGDAALLQLKRTMLKRWKATLGVETFELCRCRKGRWH